MGRIDHRLSRLILAVNAGGGISFRRAARSPFEVLPQLAPEDFDRSRRNTTRANRPVRPTPKKNSAICPRSSTGIHADLHRMGNLWGGSTGTAAGLAPLRIRSTTLERAASTSVPEFARLFAGGRWIRNL